MILVRNTDIGMNLRDMLKSQESDDMAMSGGMEENEIPRIMGELKMNGKIPRGRHGICSKWK